MERKKEDRRVLYTKMFLRESLLKLLETKPIEKITPTELCRHAGINRNTFYSHYRSPEELLHSMEEELLRIIGASISGEATFVSTLYAMKENAESCKILLSPNCHSGIWEKIFQGSTQRHLRELQEANSRLSDEQSRRITMFIVQGSIAVVQDWVQGGMQTPPEELAELLTEIAAGGTSTFHGGPQNNL